jgi:uncharacterized RDD family membrane protein YckC
LADRLGGSVTLRSVPPTDEPTAAGTQQTAGFGARFLALLVDWLLCLMLAGLVARPPATGIWVYPFLIAEYGIFVGLYIQTPGMWLAKVRCVSTSDMGPIGVLRAVLRTVLMCLVVPVLIMDSYGRGLHDKAAGSIMLSARPVKS